MDSIEHVKKLREEYERSLDAAESRRTAYHQAVLDLYQSGTPLREIAKELGLSHQRVHQIVSSEPPRRSRLPRAAGGMGAVLVLVAATFGALRLADAPPFVTTVQLPPVLGMRDDIAATRLLRDGINVRVVYRRRSISPARINYVYAQSPPYGQRIAKGTTVTLYAEIPSKHFTCRTPSGPCPTTVLYHTYSIHHF